MKKYLKKEIIISFIVGIILASSISAYAVAINASNIDYKNGKTVEYALNDLYNKQKIQNGIDEYLKQFGIYLIFYDGQYYNTDKFQVNICSGQLQEDKSIIANKNGLERWY